MQEFTKPPKICCCIPVKLIVLLMQAIALVTQIYILCFHAQDKRIIFGLVIMAVLTIFTMIGFIFNHRTVMRVHSFFIMLTIFGSFGYILYRAYSLIEPHFFNSSYHGSYRRELELFPYELLCFAVILLYFVFCIVLIAALEETSALPQHTINYHASQSTQDLPTYESCERAQLIYPVYPKL